MPSRHPVICGIGHQIDVSIADVVAHTSCKTPTEAAEFLAGRVGQAAYRVEEAGRALARQATDRLQQQTAQDTTAEDATDS